MKGQDRQTRETILGWVGYGSAYSERENVALTEQDRAGTLVKVLRDAWSVAHWPALPALPGPRAMRVPGFLNRFVRRGTQGLSAERPGEDGESQAARVDAGKRRVEDLRVASPPRAAASSLRWPSLPAFLSRAMRAMPCLTDLLRQERQDLSGPDEQPPEPQPSMALERLHEMLQSDALHSERLTGAPDNPTDDLPNRTDDGSGVRSDPRMVTSGTGSAPKG